MKYSLLGLGLSLILTSCGAPSSSGGGKRVIRFNSLSMNPVTLKEQGVRCTSSSLSQEQMIFNIKRMLNGSQVNETVDLQTLLNTNQKLTDKSQEIIHTHVMKASSEDVFKAIFYSDETFDITEQRQDVISEGDDIKVCAQNMSYQRDSYKNAGLIVTNAIFKTQSAVTSLVSDYIAPIKVSITPLQYQEVSVSDIYGNVYQNEKGYRVNNAYYSPGDLEVVFLPQSAEVIKSKFFGKALWEVPMVASHEYGHHVFSSLYSNFEPDYEDNLQSHLNFECFDNRYNDNLAINVVSAYNNTTRNEIRGGLNEGFADLMAQYTLTQQENYLGDLNCFKKNREVKSANFYDGTAKKFNRANTSRIFSSIEYEVNSCNRADLQGIHHIGAIFAHTTDAIQSAYDLTQTQKLSNVLTWIKRLNDDESLNSATGKSYLRKTLQHFKNVMIERHGSDYEFLMNDYFSGV